MKLNERLAAIEQMENSKVEITKIYHGKDHACRCGCCGRYFEKGDKGFTRAINRLNSDDFRCFENQVRLETYRNVHDGKILPTEGWINIPYDYDNDKCYCVYIRVAEAKEGE